jgi:hypothetical protein
MIRPSIYTVGEPIPTPTFDPERPDSGYAPVTLRDIFGSIGEPDTYSARILPGRHGDPGLALHLFYNEGIVVQGIYPLFDVPASAAYPNCKIDISLDLPSTNIYFTNLTDLQHATHGQGLLGLIKEDDEVATWSGARGVRLTVCDM